MEFQYETLKEFLKQDLTRNWGTFRNMRRYLHKHPEKTTAEYNTAKYISNALEKAGIPYRSKVGGQGIVGLIEGKKFGPTIAIRGEMDALEIEETTGLSYSSVNPGLMHACGHDFHMSAVLSVGIILNQYKEMLPGNVKLIFQPGEENGPVGGAKPMISEGVMQDPPVNAIFSAHVLPSIPLGKISIICGPAMAAVDNFLIRIHGKGGHAAMPQNAIDPINIVAQIIVALNTIIARNISPLESAVLSVGRIHGGTRRNIIPDTVEFEGTVRTFSPKIRRLIKKRIHELCNSLSVAHGATAEIKWFESYDTTVNHPEMVKLAKNSICNFFGYDVIEENVQPIMGADDFTYFLKQVKGAYLWVGTQKGIPLNLHSGNLIISDEVLRYLIMTFLGIIIGYFKDNKDN